MKHGKELLAGVTLAATATLGATACTGGRHHKEPQPAPSQVGTSSPYGLRLETIAGRILKLAQRSPARYDGFPFNIGFFYKTKGEGELTYVVQTAEASPDPADTQVIEVDQNGPDQANFDLVFSATHDRRWNMYCFTNDPLTNDKKQTVAELGEQSVQRGTNAKPVEQPAEARAMLNNAITNLEVLVSNAEATPSTSVHSTIPPSPNVCDL